LDTTAGNIFRKLVSEIKHPDRKEAESIAFILMEHFFQAKRIDVLVDKPVSGFLMPEDVIDRINENVPVQYVTGNAEFYGRKFMVNEHVLIPRPETEELVQLIIKENKGALSIWDIGTGSGCIPVSLKLEMPDAQVYASDISEGALEVAVQNANLYGADITFAKQDIFQDGDFPGAVDIIVSNPPYITASEKILMHENVLKYEPEGALFVEDANPLIFYDRIADVGLKKIKRGGRLYFEINELFGEQMQEMLLQKGYAQVEVIKDINDKSRIVKATLDQ
jgi:release factor glutamine methyltransferase